MKTRSCSGKTRCYISLRLDALRFGRVRPGWADSDPLERSSNLWLRAKIGFYPQEVFFAFDEATAARQAGYRQQWWRWWHQWHRDGKVTRVFETRGKPRNRVMAVFTVDALAEPTVYIDDKHFCDIINDVVIGRRTEGVQPVKCAFKRSWSACRWLRLAQEEPDRVVALVPEVDLRRAVELWVRNQKTKRQLEAMGFNNVKVKRFPSRSN